MYCFFIQYFGWPYQPSSGLHMLLKVKEGWYGQPKYCYEKAIHVVMISFAWTSRFFVPVQKSCLLRDQPFRFAVWPKSDVGLSFGLKLGGGGGGVGEGLDLLYLFLKLEHQEGQCFPQKKTNVRRLTAKDRKRINQVNLNLQSWSYYVKLINLARQKHGLCGRWQLSETAVSLLCYCGSSKR